MKTLQFNKCCSIIIAALLALFVGTADAQRTAAVPSYPAKPIRFIVPQATGGSNDILARYVGYQLSEHLGNQVIIDYRAGADGIIGTEITAHSAPDGYTWMMASRA